MTRLPSRTNDRAPAAAKTRLSSSRSDSERQRPKESDQMTALPVQTNSSSTTSHTHEATISVISYVLGLYQRLLVSPRWPNRPSSGVRPISKRVHHRQGA